MKVLLSKYYTAKSQNVVKQYFTIVIICQWIFVLPDPRPEPWRERDMITWSQSLAAHSFAPGPRKQNRFWRCYKIMDVMAIFTRLVYWKLGSTQFCFSRTSFLVSHFARVYVLCQRGVIAIFQLNCVFLDTLHLHYRLLLKLNLRYL